MNWADSVCSHGISNMATKIAILEEITRATGFENPTLELANPCLKPGRSWITSFPE